MALATSELPTTLWGWVIALGGPAVIAGAVAYFFSNSIFEGFKSKLNQQTERLKGELSKETETHKLALKKLELLFQRKVEATTAFIGFRQKMNPQYSNPGMEWEDAIQAVISNMGRIETGTDTYLSQHGAVISKNIRKKIDELRELASINKFAGYEEHTSDKDARDAAERIWQILLPEIEADMLEELQKTDVKLQ